MNQIAADALSNTVGTLASGAVIGSINILKDQWNMKKQNINSIDPRPGFTLVYYETPKGIEVYLKVQEYSNNWVEWRIVVNPFSNSFVSTIEDTDLFPVIRPKQIIEVLIGHIDKINDDLLEQSIQIGILYRGENKKEAWVDYTLFDDSVESLKTLMKPKHQILEDLKIEFTGINRATNRMVWFR